MRYRILLLVTLLLCSGYQPLSQASEVSPLPALRSLYQGDLDNLLKRRVIRVLVVYQKGFYYLHNGAQKGITTLQIREFEKWLNHKYFRHQKLKLRIEIIPVRRDQLFKKLITGAGDIAIANLTITPGRQALVSFSRPVYQGSRS
ncbi:transporter substrate-binding domain-containing protein [Dongshaea marina]|uniref:transporter substrate-binding domain-containing protein n=1 Tax=Dongshaea marina TaxID=2047966 RepID=UPI000D3E7152|nr:transporter substrate-binding domain-containing protein [Dongshaea marina]